MELLKDKVAVITGGSSGIGLATAKRFAEEGAYVFITGRRQEELDKAVEIIGENVTAIQGDVTKAEDLSRIAATVKAERGIVHAVISNAGVTEQGYIESLTSEHFDKVFNLNAKAPVFLVQSLLPLMSEGGSIVLVGSAMHSMGIAGHTAYAATKAALRSYVRTWAAEFKNRGIRANVLSPGVTDTPMLSDQGAGLGDKEAVINNYLSMIPLARVAQAEEIANAAVFLASDQSSYVTGADIAADGGVAQV
ncbi:SDR family oxidoreductase [bacterium]|nr:MAG: SDR family oxidoreductase [bacterium]